MRRPTNITIACVVILIIIAICVFTFNANKKTSTNNVKNEEVQNINEAVNNNVNENITNIIENTIQEEQDENATQNNMKNEVKNDIPSTETFTETPQTAEEKAIGIVGDDWNGSDVSFSVTGMDANGNYIVQVTDSNTAVLAFYTVNVGDGSFTKREMN